MFFIEYGEILSYSSFIESYLKKLERVDDWSKSPAFMNDIDL